MKIVIVGSGMMGSAMAIPALDNGHSVLLVGTPLDREIIDGLRENGCHKTLKREMKGDIAFKQFDEVADADLTCDILISGVSSFGVEWFAENVIPRLKSGQRVLAITKGLHKNEDGSLCPFPVWFSALRKDVSFNAVGGPCISFELADRIHTEVAFCGKEQAVLAELRQAFQTEYYHISITDDICGIETAVALKNAYAMAVSLAIGAYTKNDPALSEKYNAQAGLFYEATREMSAIIRLFGGREDALFFGAGDLYVTVFGGRTRRLGTILGSGVDFAHASEILKGVTLESVAIIRLLGEFFGEKLGEYPLMQHIHERITENTLPPIPWDRMRRDSFDGE